MKVKANHRWVKVFLPLLKWQRVLSFRLVPKARLGNLVFALIIIASQNTLNAQITATFKADSNKIEIGDHLAMKLVVNAPKDYWVQWPTFDGDSIGRIDIIKMDKIDTARLGDKTIYSQTVTISAYDEGQYFFSPMKVYYKNNSTGAIDTAYTNDWLLQVSTIAVDTSKPIKPIKAPLKVEYQIREFLWWIVALVAFIIAAIVGYFLYKKYKKKPTVVVRPRPSDPPHIWAQKELRKLEQDKLWQKDEVKQYHSRLTDILRYYLEYRYDYYAMESTTGEIQEELNRLNIPLNACEKIMETLRLADFVKFAKLNPAPDQNTKSLSEAYSFIEMTKPMQDEMTEVKVEKPTMKKERRK